MRSRDGELVMPGMFLPPAERFGLIGAIDRWVIGQAARMAAHGRAVNVNLSAQSLGDPQLSGLIEKLIERETRTQPCHVRDHRDGAAPSTWTSRARLTFAPRGAGL